jgi:hypothetical protein
MLVTTIQAMLVLEKNRIYVVKGNIEGTKRVIYVGKADKHSVAERIVMHLKGNEKGLQRFGKMLHQFSNDGEKGNSSHSWEVEVLTKEECEKRLGKIFHKLDDAEKTMVNELKPLTNRHFRD